MVTGLNSTQELPIQPTQTVVEESCCTLANQKSVYWLLFVSAKCLSVLSVLFMEPSSEILSVMRVPKFETFDPATPPKGARTGSVQPARERRGHRR